MDVKILIAPSPPFSPIVGPRFRNSVLVVQVM